MPAQIRAAQSYCERGFVVATPSLDLPAGLLGAIDQIAVVLPDAALRIDCEPGSGNHDVHFSTQPRQAIPALDLRQS